MTRHCLAAAAILLAAAASCTPGTWDTYRSTLPADQRAYMEKVDNNGPSAKVSQKDHEAASKRAEEFLTKFAGGFQRDADRTFRIKSKGGSYAYSIDSRKGMSDQEFSVMCTHSTQGSSEEAWRNARIAQYFIQTGDLPFPQLVSK